MKPQHGTHAGSHVITHTTPSVMPVIQYKHALHRRLRKSVMSATKRSKSVARVVQVSFANYALGTVSWKHGILNEQ